jgi:hypothetical protein
LRWLHANSGFRQIYNLARDIGMDGLADEALHDATAPTKGAIAGDHCER